MYYDNINNLRSTIILVLNLLLKFSDCIIMLCFITYDIILYLIYNEL